MVTKVPIYFLHPTIRLFAPPPYLIARELDGVVPPDSDHRRQRDHEDQRVHAQHPDGVLLLHDPRGQRDAEVHHARAVRVAVQLPVAASDVVRESLVRCGTGDGGIRYKMRQAVLEGHMALSAGMQ